ncbi:MAG: baseplate J/gp47 family protein [Anaerolineales bacterium]|nr:baseplate J/gp47 family protein [Anaerolineales bacterium]
MQDVLIEAYTSPEIKAMQLSGALPSEVITVEVEGRASRPVSGQIRLPDQPARGAVLFTNLTDQSIEISAGTVVQPVNSSAGEFSAIPASGSLRYATQKTVILPAGPGQTIEVSVQCLTPGKKGNQPANTLEAIEGFLGTQVSVTNPQPIDGGADRLEPAPNERDRLELARELNDSLRLTALEEMQNGLAPGDLLIPSSLVEGATLEKTFQPEDNQPADQLSLNWRLSYQARVVRFEEQLALAQAVFDANLPQGYTPMPDTLTVETVAEPQQLDEQSTSWKLHAVRRLTAQISDSLARQTVLGLPVQEAAQRMQSALQLEQTPQIHLIPDWWPRLPVLPFRIQIIQRSLYDLVSGEPPGL